MPRPLTTVKASSLTIDSKLWNILMPKSFLLEWGRVPGTVLSEPSEIA
jgi:hypothetical protein